MTLLANVQVKTNENDIFNLRWCILISHLYFLNLSGSAEKSSFRISVFLLVSKYCLRFLKDCASVKRQLCESTIIEIKTRIHNYNYFYLKHSQLQDIFLPKLSFKWHISPLFKKTSWFVGWMDGTYTFAMDIRKAAA